MNEMETNKTEVLLMLFVAAKSSILSLSVYFFSPTDISILTGWPSFKMDTIFFPSFLLINIVTTSLPVKKKLFLAKCTCMYSIITVYGLIFSTYLPESQIMKKFLFIQTNSFIIFTCPIQFYLSWASGKWVSGED